MERRTATSSHTKEGLLLSCSSGRIASARLAVPSTGAHEQAAAGAVADADDAAVQKPVHRRSETGLEELVEMAADHRRQAREQLDAGAVQRNDAAIARN
jgi:hypothetical protein